MIYPSLRVAEAVGARAPISDARVRPLARALAGALCIVVLWTWACDEDAFGAVARFRCLYGGWRSWRRRVRGR